MRYRIDRFRGWSIEAPYRGVGSQKRSIRVGVYVQPEHFESKPMVAWFKRHPVDTAVAYGFGLPLFKHFGVGLRVYRNVAAHLSLKVGRRSYGVSLLGRWEPDWYGRWAYDRYTARLDRERLAWIKQLGNCPECGEWAVDAGECFECAATLDEAYYS